MTSVRIVDACASELTGLLELERSAFTDYYEAHRFGRSQFEYYVDNPRAVVLAAMAGSRVVGYALGIVKSGTLDHLAKLHSLAVLPQWRRRGIAHRLLGAFHDRVRKRSCLAVLMDVAEPNAAMRALAERLGYRQDRRLPDHYGAGVDGVRMRLPLESPHRSAGE